MKYIFQNNMKFVTILLCVTITLCSGFDLQRFKTDIKQHEGLRYEIYPDPIHGAAAPTLGYGHLVKRGDKHYGLPIGTPVSPSDVEAYLTADLQIAVSESRRLYSNFDSLPSEVQLIIANMMFNMGYSRLSQFRKMKAAVTPGTGERLQMRW